MLERFGLASSGGERLYDQPMGVLAQVVDRQRTMGRFERLIRVPPSPETLQALSLETGGEFFTATDDERLREVYEELVEGGGYVGGAGGGGGGESCSMRVSVVIASGASGASSR